MIIILSNIYPQLSFIAESFKNLIPEAFPAVLAIFLLCFIKVDDRPLLTWDDFETGIDWNVVFLFGGGISMSKALIGSGFSEWVALLMSNFSSNWIGNIWVISALSALLAFIITYPASNTAAALIACPLAVSLAKSVGVNPMAAVISAALASSISSALPSTTPPMAIVYGSGYVKLWNMFKVGMISDIIRLILLIVLEPYLVNILLFLKGLV
ncbi:MAG: SLC13 family permease [Candidatus Methanomethylicia archaeon]